MTIQPRQTPPEKALQAVKVLQQGGLAVESVTLEGKAITLRLRETQVAVSPVDLVEP